MKQLYLVFNLILLTFFHNIANASLKKELSSCDPQLCKPSSVLSYSPGKDKSGNQLPVARQNTSLLFDLDNDTGEDYVSLGFNGIIVLKYDFPIENLPGNDILIAESNPSDLDCSLYKPAVAVYASQDSFNWILVGDGCQDLSIDFPSYLPWVKYLKIIDISNPNDFTEGNADGYHLDGVKALKCPNYTNPSKPIYPFVECVKSNQDGSFTATFGYENTNANYVNISSGTLNQISGSNITSSITLPEIFSNGKVHNAFQATFTSGTVTWSLKGPDNVIRTTEASALPSQCLSAVIRGGGDICSGTGSALFIDLEGEGPWTISYRNSDNVVTTVTAGVDENPKRIDVYQASTYVLQKVTDKNGIEASLFGSAQVLQKPRPNAVLSGDGNTCNDSTILTVTINCKCIPFSLTYSDGTKDTTVITTDKVYYITGYVGKTYQLKSISNFFCEGTVAGKVTVKSSKPTATFASMADRCVDPGNKELLAVKLSGAAPWTVSYSDGLTDKDTTVSTSTFNIPAIGGRTYSLKNVKDANCAVKVSCAVKVNESPTASISGGKKVCKGTVSPISITLKGEAPFDFSYSDGTNTVTETAYSSNIFTFNGIAGKAYTLISVKDKNCLGKVSGCATLEEFAVPEAVITGGGQVCKGSTLPITITLRGVQPFTFSYSDGAKSFTETDYNSNSFTFNGEVGKTYNLLAVTDGNCTGTTGGFATVEESAVPTAVVSGSKSICTGTEISEIMFSFSGTAPFTYVYSDGKTQVENTTSESSVKLKVTGVGTYELISIHDAACVGTVSGKAQITMPSTLANFGINLEYCFGEEILLTPNFQGAAVMSYDFTSNGKGIIINSSNQYRYIPAAGETGEISFSLSGKDVCNNNFTPISKKTRVRPAVKAVFSYTPSEVVEGQAVSFVMENAEATSQYWLIGKDQISTENSFEHIFTQAGKYKVVLAVLEKDCYGFDTLEITVKPAEPEVYVPTIFCISSNDPENNVIKVYGEGISDSSFKFKIFNKWGNLLYEVSNFQEANSQGWDGKAAGTGELQPLGVYTYSLDGVFITGKKFHKTGTVTLIK